jgi:hypothetical protein
MGGPLAGLARKSKGRRTNGGGGMRRGRWKRMEDDRKRTYLHRHPGLDPGSILAAPVDGSRIKSGMTRI